MIQTHSVQYSLEQPVERSHLWSVSVGSAIVCWTSLTQCLLVQSYQLPNVPVHHQWWVHLLIQHLLTLLVLLPWTVRRRLSLASSSLPSSPSYHQTCQVVAVLHFLLCQCLQSLPLLSSVVAGVSAPLPCKDLGSFSSTTNSEQS